MGASPARRGVLRARGLAPSPLQPDLLGRAALTTGEGLIQGRAGGCFPGPENSPLQGEAGRSQRSPVGNTSPATPRMVLACSHQVQL